MTDPKPTPARKPRTNPAIPKAGTATRVSKKPPHAPSTMTPRRLAVIVQSMFVGDTIRAACGSAAVPVPTYQRWMQHGTAAINQARALCGEDDIEGAVWFHIEEHGGPNSGKADSPYWTAPAPDWWPKSLADRWLNVILVMMVYHARGQAEQVYRQAITRAATGQNPDWRAAEFMLTHSFDWRKTEQVEVTGAGGGPVQVQGDEASTLAALALLADRKKAIES